MSRHHCVSLPRRALGTVSFLVRVWGTVDPLGSEHLVFLTSAASGSLAMTSGSSSGPSVLPVPKSAGIVEGAETSFKEEIVLDQQLTKAFQTGLRRSFDDPDHDTMSDW